MVAPHPLSQRTKKAFVTAVAVLTWPLAHYTVLFRTSPGPSQFLISSFQSLVLFLPFFLSTHFLPCVPHHVHPHFCMSTDLPDRPLRALIRANSFNVCVLHILSPPSDQDVVCLLSYFPPGPIPHWSGQGSALIHWFLYLKLIPYARLTHCPDDGGSKEF
jgi:hypothetical protein